VQHIVAGLRLELSSDEQNQLAKATTKVAGASEEYLRGRHCMGRFIYHTIAREDIDAAIEHFERAVAIDANFALAYSALGGCYVNRVLKGLGEASDHELAQAAFSKALALDPMLLEARMHMVFIYLSSDNKQKAREEVELLRSEYPNDVGVHFVRGVLARLDADYDRALRSFERMAKLNPAERVVVSYNRARVFMYQRRWDDALLELDQGAAMEPDHPLVKTFRARVLYYRGEVGSATELLQSVLESHPKMDGIRPILATCLAAAGKTEEAWAQLTDRVREVAAADHDIAYWLGSAFALLGDKEQALEWLDAAIKLGNENYLWFQSDPNWASLHDEPRFRDLTTRVADEQRKRRGHG
jgi:serine/threonine-protein kinase